RFGSADMDIEILDSSFRLIDHSTDDVTPASRHEFHSDAVALGKTQLHQLAQLGARRNRRDDFPFLPTRFDSLFPVAGTRLTRLRENQVRPHQAKNDQS